MKDFSEFCYHWQKQYVESILEKWQEEKNVIMPDILLGTAVT
jgi:hypothetical protein